MFQLLANNSINPSIGLGLKCYVVRSSDSNTIELRLDFKFPIASLDSFELEIEGLKIV